MSTKPTDGHPTPVDRVNPESLNSPAGLFPVAFVVISRSSPRVTPLPLVIFVWPIPVPINEIDLLVIMRVVVHVHVSVGIWEVTPSNAVDTAVPMSYLA